MKLRMLHYLSGPLIVIFACSSLRSLLEIECSHGGRVLLKRECLGGLLCLGCDGMVLYQSRLFERKEEPHTNYLLPNGVHCKEGCQ